MQHFDVMHLNKSYELTPYIFLDACIVSFGVCFVYVIPSWLLGLFEFNTNILKSHNTNIFSLIITAMPLGY